jgi:hypothetical protein
MDVSFVFGEFSIELAVTFFTWLIANWAYFEFRRTGDRGFKRLVAFCLGWPASFVTMLMVAEGSLPRVRDDDEGIAELVEEIKADRRLRRGSKPALPDGNAESLGD